MGKKLDKILKDYCDKYHIIFSGDEDGSCIPQFYLITLPENYLKRDNNNNLFTILHEIGHCETFKSKYDRGEKEYYATQWAITNAYKYNVIIKKSEQDGWQKYINSFFNTEDKTKYQLDWSPMD